MIQLMQLPFCDQIPEDNFPFFFQPYGDKTTIRTDLHNTNLIVFNGYVLIHIDQHLRKGELANQKCYKGQ